MSLFDDLKSGTMKLADDARVGGIAAGTAIEKEAVDVVHDPAGAARGAANWAYGQIIGNDIRTLMSHDPKVTAVDKVLAGISIASNFVGPEGKLIDKALTVVAKDVLEHGGEELAAKGLARLEESLGKDGLKRLTNGIDHMAAGMKNGLDTAEKVIEGLNAGASFKRSVTEGFDDLKAMIGDAATAAHATGGDRVAAWAKVVADIGKEGKDMLGAFQTAGRVGNLVHAPSVEKLAKLQKDATSTLLQDAEKFKNEHGRTFVEGKDLVIDVRNSKNMTKETQSMLATMHDDARAAGKHLVVFDPQISAEQERTLLAGGISVAKSQVDLAKISAASRTVGTIGVDLLNVDRRIEGSDAGKAARAKYEASETKETLGSDSAATEKKEKILAAKHVFTPDMSHADFAALMSKIRGGQSHARSNGTPRHELGQDPPTRNQNDLSVGR